MSASRFLKKVFKQDLVIGIILFLVVLSIYIYTLCPTVYLEDSGELVAVAQSLGIAHPPGFPLFALLGKLFTFLPISSIAWRVNLMSAVFSAASLAILYLTLRKLRINQLISFFCGLCFSLTVTLWSQSVAAEVYSLNLFLFALAFYLLVIWKQAQQNKYLFWLFFVLGLSLTNHLFLMAGLLPIFALAVFLFNKSKWDYKKILIMFLVFCLGLSIYLFMPIRSLANPEVDFGNPENITNFIRTISRSHYKDVARFSGIDTAKYRMIGDFGFLLEENFGWLMLITGLVGIGCLIFKQKKWLLITFGFFLFGSILIIVLRDYEYGFGVMEVFKVYFLPAFYIFSIWSALGFFWLNRILKRFITKPYYLNTIIIIIAFMIIAGTLFSKNFQQNNLSNYYLEHDFTYNLLTGLDQDAVLIIKEDNTNSSNFLFGLMYWQIAEGVRTDVTIEATSGIDIAGHFRQVVGESIDIDEYKSADFSEKRQIHLANVLEKVYDQRPVYTSFTDVGNYYSRSNGYAHRVFKTREEAEAYTVESIEPLRNLIAGLADTNNYSRFLLSKFYYNLASYYLEKGDLNQAQKNLVFALEYDTQLQSTDFSDYKKYRNKILNNTAEENL